MGVFLILVLIYSSLSQKDGFTSRSRKFNISLKSQIISSHFIQVVSNINTKSNFTYKFQGKKYLKVSMPHNQIILYCENDILNIRVSNIFGESEFFEFSCKTIETKNENRKFRNLASKVLVTNGTIFSNFNSNLSVTSKTTIYQNLGGNIVKQNNSSPNTYYTEIRDYCEYDVITGNCYPNLNESQNIGFNLNLGTLNNNSFIYTFFTLKYGKASVSAFTLSPNMGRINIYKNPLNSTKYIFYQDYSEFKLSNLQLNQNYYFTGYIPFDKNDIFNIKNNNSHVLVWMNEILCFNSSLDFGKIDIPGIIYPLKTVYLRVLISTFGFKIKGSISIILNGNPIRATKFQIPVYNYAENNLIPSKLQKYIDVIITCPKYYMNNEYKECYSCDSRNKVYFNSTCVSKSLLINATLYLTTPAVYITCTEAKQYNYNNSCIKKCPTNAPYVDPTNTSCVNLNIDNYYLLNNVTVYTCPEGYSYFTNRTCYLKKNVSSNLMINITNTTIIPTLGSNNSLSQNNSIILNTSNNNTFTNIKITDIANLNLSALSQKDINENILQIFNNEKLQINQSSPNTSIIQNSPKQQLSNINNIATSLIGSGISNLTTVNPSFGIQIASSESNLTTISIENKLSILDFSNCVNQLKIKNKIPMNTSLVYFKTDLKNSNSTSIVNFKFYNPLNNKLLDTSVCQGIPYYIVIPINNTNTDMIKYFLSHGINVSDPTDPFFTNRCMNYDEIISNFTNNNNYYTLQSRIDSFYQIRITSCESSGVICNPINSMIKNYINCSCISGKNNLAKLSFIQNLRSKFPTINLSIILCIQRFSNIFSNKGFILSTSIFTFGIFFSLLSFIYKKNIIEKSLEQIKKYDSYTDKKEEILKNQEKAEIKESELMSQIFKKNSPNQASAPKKSFFFQHRNTNFMNQYELRNELQNMNNESHKKAKLEYDNVDFSHEKDKFRELEIFMIQNVNIKEVVISKNDDNKNEIVLEEKIDKKDIIDKIVRNLTVRDYEELSVNAQIMFDKRSSFEFFIQTLCSDNIIMKTFFIKSLRIPRFIQIIAFTNVILLSFLVNCLLFQDGEISDLTDFDIFNSLVKDPTLFILLSLSSMLISMIANFFICLWLIIPNKFLTQLNSSILTQNLEIIIREYEIFISNMKIRYFMFYFISMIFQLFSIYYLTVFFSIYNQISIVIILRGCFSIFIDIVIIDTFIPLLIMILRILAIKFRSLRTLYQLKSIVGLIRLLNG